MFCRSVVRNTNLFPNGNVTYVSKFGANVDIDTAAEDVWTPGGSRVWLSAAVTLEVVSTTSSDGTTGTGAREVVVQGLDAAWKNQSATFALTGTTKVATTHTWLRVNRAYVSSVGTYCGNNTGTLTVRTATTDASGATQTEIRAGIGQTEQTHFSIPISNTLHVMNAWANTDGAKVISPTMWTNRNVNDVTTPFGGAKRKLWGTAGVLGHIQHSWDTFPAIRGPSDVWLASASAANNTEIEAGFDGVIVDN